MKDPFCYLNYNLMICTDVNGGIQQYNNEDNFSLYEEIIKILISLSIIVFGFATSCIFVGFFIVDPLIKKDLPTIKMYAELEREAKIEMEFLETNYDKFDDLSMNKLSDSYCNEYFEMETPKGIVYMSYDRELELFNYYCDKKEMPYYYLECVARNFIIKFDCKSIYISFNNEMKKIFELKKEQDNRLKIDKKNEVINDKFKNSNVFVKFKNNVLDNKIIDNNSLIPEKCNIFKYKGKIIDYKNDILNINEKDNDTEEYIKIDYKTFKKTS